jgi:hypothetical protein
MMEARVDSATAATPGHPGPEIGFQHNGRMLLTCNFVIQAPAESRFVE